MNLKYFLREVYINFQRNILMSLTAISTFLVLSVVLGFFFILVWNLNYLTLNMASQLRIVARLHVNLNKRQIADIASEVRNIPNIEEVKFVSKKEALKRLEEKLKGQINLANLKTNPLPDYLEIKPVDYIFVKECADLIEKIKGIDSVKYGENIVPKIIKLSQAIRITGLFIVVLLIISSTFIISNTIKLTIYARRKEIKIMQLVGAADWFIRWPFILEGVAQGVFGSLVAIIFYYIFYPVFYQQIYNQIPFIPMLTANLIIPKLALYLIIIAVVLSASGSYFSINKFLKEI